VEVEEAEETRRTGMGVSVRRQVVEAVVVEAIS
jgi:hypothetical protein